MPPSTQADLLEPIDLAKHLDKVELYLGQVCQMAGISKMQLDYWTNKAQIPTKGRKQRIYDMDAVETVMLIKQAKDKGLNLGAAIEAARRLLPWAPEPLRRPLGWHDVDVDPGTKLDPGERGQARHEVNVPRRARV